MNFIMTTQNIFSQLSLGPTFSDHLIAVQFTENPAASFGTVTAIGAVVQMPRTTSAAFTYMTVRQAADELQVQRKTVYEWIKSGLVRAGILPGGTEYRIHRGDWANFLDSLFTQGVRPSARLPLKPPCATIEEGHGSSPRPQIKPDFFTLGAEGRRAGKAL
ncbi:helix-turn-helix domain-containing protein [Paramagnetospirillum marisnigri]|nr:helix-turn-helix domain-containing protein [Paramagnetospirillum marisnigri]